MALQKITLKVLLLLGLPATSAFADKTPVNDSDLVKIIYKGINYLTAQQIKNQGDSISFAGEWPSFIYNTAKIPFLGKKGKSAYDSNVFNTLFVHNALAELYFSLNNYQPIVPVISLAQKNFKNYKNNCSFNFWPLMSRPEHLKCKHKNCKQRRPVNFKYHYAFINNYANIFDDADDTSAGFLAYYYSNKIKNSSGSPILQPFKPEPYYNKLVQYRDTGTRKSNWYNKKTGFNYRTGAYLTWFGADRKNSGFFSWFFPYHEKQNILYGRNEVDCVVNANILRALYIMGDTNIAGISESKEFLRQAISKKKCMVCGVYYPTEFSFHYAIARAMAAGVAGFDDLKHLLIKEIHDSRNKDGFWNSQLEGNDVHCTLYAINALMSLNDGEKSLPMIEEGINYVIKNMISEQEQVHWRGGVFFSGGSAIRYEHVWRSDAYTTCLALEALANYLKLKKHA